MAKTANEELLDALVRHQVYLLRYSGHVRNLINKQLDATEASIAGLIVDRLAGKSALATPSDYRRLEALMKAIRTRRDKAWSTVYEAWAQEMEELAVQEAARLQTYVGTVSPTVVQLALPSAERLRAVALSRPFQGRILKAWAEQMAANDLATIQSAIQQGMVSGLSNRAIARLVVGTASMDGADGVLEMTRHQVASVTRTAVMHVAQYSRSEVVAANSDLFSEELFVATLDSRTTPVCRARDGETYPIGKGPQPPLHFGCRSTRVPMINGGPIGERPAKPVTEKMLLREFARANGLSPVPAERKYLPRGTKGAFDQFSRRRIRELTGQVPAKTSYNEWLRGQSAEFQTDVLGKTKAKLFRDGGLSLDKFVDRGGNELTLAELARTEAAAFRAAGLNPKEYNG